MNPNNIPFRVTDWEKIPVTEHKGETGTAYWRTLQFGSLRVRVVEYSADYRADHWCEKGHILYCIEGEMITELKGGEEFILKAGMSYEVSDDFSSHRSRTEKGAKLFIVDGEFLKLK